MSWLRRRDPRAGHDDSHQDGGPDVQDGPVEDEESQEVQPESSASVLDDSDPRPDRSDGPFDVSEIDPHEGGDAIDLGALRLPSTPGLELRLEVEESSSRVVAVTAVLGDSAAQIQAFAAPRTVGIWRDVRHEISTSLREQGAQCEEADGTFGVELVANVAVDGSAETQVARFVGIDGPRWFLRAVLTGPAALDTQAAEPLLALLRGIVVVRGSEAMPPRDLLMLHLPHAEDGAAVAEAGQRLDQRPGHPDDPPV